MSKDRWLKEQEYRHNRWRNRSERLAELVPPNKSIIEFGCGPNLGIKDFLPEDADYLPTDLSSWKGKAKVIDLDKPRGECPEKDVAVFGGVLEFVRDVESAIRWLNVRIIVCSYAVHKRWRYKSTGELIALFEECGYRLEYAEPFDSKDPSLLMRFRRE